MATRQSGQTAGTSGGSTADEGFLDTYAAAIGLIFVALVVTHLPIVNFVNFVPTLKEIGIAAAVVAGTTSITEDKEGAKFALVSGMIAAVLFNVLYIAGSFAFGAIAYGGEMMSGAGAAGPESGMMGGALLGFAALTNLFGLFFFSPVGYAIGGLIGAQVND